MTTIAEYLDRTDVTTPVGTTPMVGLRDYLGASATEDPLLKTWYGPAIDWVHQKLDQRDFVDDEGADVDPPDQVVLGVYRYVQVLRAFHRRAGGNAQGVKKIKTGDREEEYADPSGVTAAYMAAQAAWAEIEPYVEDVSLAASGGGW